MNLGDAEMEAQDQDEDQDQVPKTTICYHRSGPLDEENDEQEAIKLERGMKECLAGKSDENSAVKLVKVWTLEHNYFEISGSSFIGISGLEVSGLERKYIEEEYWNVVFMESEYKENFWSEQFKENETTYRNDQISKYIPDDRVHRMVLHYLRNWRLWLSRYILDEKISIEERKLVLTKQIENFAFISRKKPFGSLWKMNSEPNTLLEQALHNIGVTTIASDEKGDPLRDIVGKIVSVYASEGLSKSAAAGPSPDEKDKKIYNYIYKYAIKKLGPSKVHNSWTMVKCSFKYNKIQYRCYAFSGQPSNEKNKIPLEWWEKRSETDAWDDGEEIQFADGNTLQIANSLVLSLFKAHRFDIEDDLKKLTLYIAYEKVKEAQSLISDGRKDGHMIDYGIFHDLVQEVVDRYVGKIEKAMLNILKTKVPGFHKMQYLCCLTVGGKNQQFEPNKEEIKNLLSASGHSPNKVDGICDILCKMSQNHHRNLEEQLDQLPGVFLNKIEERIKTFKCGEDNVIDVVLSKLLQFENCDAFMNIKVKFVALDKDHQAGKKFCEECAEKVKLYSILPILLRDTGFTGDDFPKLAPLLETEAARGDNKDDSLI